MSTLSGHYGLGVCFDSSQQAVMTLFPFTAAGVVVEQNKADSLRLRLIVVTRGFFSILPFYFLSFFCLFRTILPGWPTWSEDLAETNAFLC